ncbi:MAG: hypothetical protein EXS64_01790 [Candidatus Latescibacteria bacterium]|nr:hypothetical protein [Candidatus Latescibacterota bacterium]
MNEEHLSILRMVAEKKLTAEEGERLLDALGGEHRSTASPPKSERREKTAESDFSFDAGKKGTFSGFKMFGKKGTFDSGMFKKRGKGDREDPFDFDTSPQTIPVSGGMTLSIQTNAGALKLLGTDQAEIRVEGPLKRHYAVSRSEDEVMISGKKFETSLIVHVPKAVGPDQRPGQPRRGDGSGALERPERGGEHRQGRDERDHLIERPGQGQHGGGQTGDGYGHAGGGPSRLPRRRHPPPPLPRLCL